MFASWIPEITELAAQRNKYGGKYNKDVRKRYTGKRCTKWLNLFFYFNSWFFDHSDIIIFILITYMLFIMQRMKRGCWFEDSCMEWEFQLNVWWIVSSWLSSLLSFFFLTRLVELRMTFASQMLNSSKHPSSTPSYDSFKIETKKLWSLFSLNEAQSLFIKCQI